MLTHIRDDNLRLILAPQEKEYIEEQYEYHQTSLIYCITSIVGLFFYAQLSPLILVINKQAYGVLMTFGFLWVIVAFCALLMFIPILLKVLKYKKLIAEQKVFLQKYNRSL
ncbi:hypothetical protein MTBPR1_40229 [Candidatus Terasakiella magnetica]|uniref:Uncharacterized protein n=1 Tax=Candidatus Terasakiella magnetica TaxID=1867952 RepID=A0A1C3RIV3_9PROT|nr:hypothetical protein [Candidatus Terasakiella magnetica]SCA57206.1 hypothetical protein MTBPR1_40229 [Candidatus Terasakiella magnetica]